MKHLLTSAAMALVLGTGAFAQTETTTPQTDDTAQTQDQAGTQATAAQEPILADELIGMSVYTTAGAEPEPIEGTVDPAQQNWEEIGQITDLVMTLDGNVSAVIVGVGGFIGVGERDVALPLEEVNVYQSEDQDPVLVVTMTQQELEAAPAYEEGTDGTQMGATTEMDTQTEPATDTAGMDESQTDTTTVDVETVETDVEDADVETDTVDTAQTDTGMSPEDQAVAPDMAQADTTVESQEATAMAQDQLDEPGTAVGQDTAMDQDAAVEESDVATTTQTDTMPTDQVETETAQTDTMTTQPAQSETAETDAIEAETVETETVETETVVTEPQDQTAATDTVTTVPTTNLQRPAMQREGFTERLVTDLTVDDLTGANVYGVNDDDIGDINDLILDAEGNISHAIISFGGFLGLGQDQVAVEFDSLQILAGAEGAMTDDVRVYINATQEQLEALPEYQE